MTSVCFSHDAHMDCSGKSKAGGSEGTTRATRQSNAASKVRYEINAKLATDKGFGVMRTYTWDSEREYRWERTVRVDIFPSDSRKAPYDSVSGVTPKRPLLRLPDVAERYRSDYAEARAIDQCDISKQSAYGSCDQLLTDLSVIRRAVRAALRARSHPPSARHKTSCLPNYTTASSRNVLCSPPKQRAALLSPLNLPKTAFLERHYPLFQKSSIPSALFPFALGVPLTAGCPKRDSFPYTSATLAVNNI